MRRLRVLFAISVVLLFVISCSGDGDAMPTASPVPIETATEETRPTAGRPPLRPTRPPAKSVPSTVWLIDVRNGQIVTLYEDHGVLARTAFFDGGQAVVSRGIDFDEREVVRFDLSGNELSRARQGAWGDCIEADTGVEVRGRFYEAVACGPISPNGRWMVYWIDEGELRMGPTGPEEPVRTQWALNLATGESTLLQDKLDICQGDSFFWPAWSSTSRYVYFGDCAEEGGRTFLSDVATGRTRQIAVGLPTFRDEPSWSPVADTLLHAGDGGAAVLEDLSRGTVEILNDVAWPARFDGTGALFFTVPRRDAPNETKVYRLADRSLLGTLPGRPVTQVPFGNVMLEFVPVVARSGGFEAALDDAPGCDGTALYTDGTPLNCVEIAYGPSISPDGSQVVVMRKTGESGPVEGPGFGSVSMHIYDIVVVDVDTGAEVVFAGSILGGNPYPTPAVWNADGTHLLVTWPMLYGP